MAVRPSGWFRSPGRRDHAAGGAAAGIAGRLARIVIDASVQDEGAAVGIEQQEAVPQAVDGIAQPPLGQTEARYIRNDGDAAAGILWVALAFSGTLALGLYRAGQGAGFIGSVVGAIVLLFAVGAIRKR